MFAHRVRRKPLPRGTSSGRLCFCSWTAADSARQTYVPTVFENLITTIPHPLEPTKTIELALWDTAGQEDFDRLRPLSYNDTDVILVVFACNHRPSLENVYDKVGRS
jgi:Rho family protein